VSLIYGIGVFSFRKKSTLIWEKQNCKNKYYSGKEVGNAEKPEEGDHLSAFLV